MSARDRLHDLARRLPHPVRHAARQVARWPRGRRMARPVRWGSLRRTRPVSSSYGLDRGTAVDRVYLDRFFDARRADIRGAVLEVGAPVFSGRFGTGVISTDVVDIDPRNDRATIVGDLGVPGLIPVESFDCVIVPQTLQYVADPRVAVVGLHAALRPGGVLLITMPMIAKLDDRAADVDHWRITPVGMRAALAAWCPGAEVTVESAGNVLTATAFLQGLAAEELRPEEFDVVDPMYPMIVMARVRRPEAG
jgi:SAM-dependent methyltransferase